MTGICLSSPFTLRRNPQFPQPRHQVLLRPVALDPVTVGAQQLQVLDVALATGAPRDDVVNLKDTERELAAASVAPAFLLAEEYVLVLPVRHRCVDIGGPGDVGAGGDQPVVEQVAHGLLQAHVDQIDGLGRDVDADPAPAQVLGGHARGSAAAGGGKPAKRGWLRKLSTTSPK